MCGLELLNPDNAERPGLQRFIAAQYERMYGARIAHFAEHLVGMRNPAGGWAAGLGYTLPGAERLFIEQYLERSIEDTIASMLGVPVHRDQIVEAGNLAATSAGAARELIVHMTAMLHGLGRTWVVFTSTRALLNSFRRLGISTISLARADPACLPDRGESWGGYYATDPHIMTANIPLGVAHLRSTQALDAVR